MKCGRSSVSYGGRGRRTSNKFIAVFLDSIHFCMISLKYEDKKLTNEGFGNCRMNSDLSKHFPQTYIVAI